MVDFLVTHRWDFGAIVALGFMVFHLTAFAYSYGAQEYAKGDPTARAIGDGPNRAVDRVMGREALRMFFYVAAIIVFLFIG